MALYSGGSESLLRLDLSFLNLKFIKADSKFESFIKSLNSPTETEYDLTIIKKWSEDQFMRFEWEYMYALVPNDSNKEVDGNIFRKIEDILLIAFPSNFRLFSYLEYSDYIISGRFKNTTYSLPTNSSQYRSYNSERHKTENAIQAEQIRFTNELDEKIVWLIKRYLDKNDSLNNFNLSISSYRNAFNHSDLSFSILSLAISLESLIINETEISHQIARCCAVLNSSTKAQGHLIYKNVKKLYKFRSQIVHGNKVDHKKLANYFSHLEAITSRCLLEIICNNFKGIDHINDAINENGYGVREILSNGYTPCEFDHRLRELILRPL